MSDLEKLTLSELLDRLADITMPESIPYIPQTLGWHLLAGALVISIAAGTWLFRRRRRATRYRWEALRALDRIGVAAGPDEKFAEALSEVVRRTALAAFPRTRVASLYGTDWLAFLDRTYGGDGFTAGPGRVLLTAPFGGPAEIDRNAMLALARMWIARHRTGLGDV